MKIVVPVSDCGTYRSRTVAATGLMQDVRMMLPWMHGAPLLSANGWSVSGCGGVGCNGHPQRRRHSAEIARALTIRRHRGCRRSGLPAVPEKLGRRKPEDL